MLEAQFKPKWTWKHWKQCKSRVYFEQKRRSMITKQVNCAATNKEVYEATNQPQCYFFWWVPLSKLPSRLLKEACLTGTLAFQVENEQKVSEIKSERKSSFYANFHHCLYLLLIGVGWAKFYRFYWMFSLISDCSKIWINVSSKKSEFQSIFP